MKKPFVVAIAGCSASGKTTFTKMLTEDLADLKVEVLTTDRFFKRPLPKMMSPLSNTEWDDYNCIESLNFEAYLEAAKEITAREDLDVVIFEGLTVLHFPELREMEDLKVFLDLDHAIRMYRRVKRNMEAGRGTMEEIADFYLNSAMYSEAQFIMPTKMQADIVLNGHNFATGLGKTIVEEYIRAHLG